MTGEEIFYPPVGKLSRVFSVIFKTKHIAGNTLNAEMVQYIVVHHADKLFAVCLGLLNLCFNPREQFRRNPAAVFAVNAGVNGQ